MPDDRDLRLDFFRGLALLMIFVDHVEMACGVDLASRLTLYGLLLCDAAEVFVFISGLVCGASYARVFHERGYLACQGKALRRAFVLYVANLATLFVVMDLILLAGLPIGEFYERLSLTGLDRPPWQTAVASFLLLYQPLGFDILTMYIQLLLLLPPLLLLESKWRGSGTLVAVALYVMAQFVPELNLPKYPELLGGVWGTGRLFNHFAWGLLFFLAAGLGARSMNRKARHSRSNLLFCALGGALLLVTVFAKAVLPLLPESRHFETISRGYDWLSSSPLGQKGTLGTGRLACFLILAHVVATLIPRDLKILRSPPASSVVACGRAALPLFCVTLILTFMAWPVVALLGAKPAVILGYELLGCLILVSIGLFQDRRLNLARPVTARLTSVAGSRPRSIEEAGICVQSGVESSRL